jgi:hypothetical protein
MGMIEKRIEKLESGNNRQLIHTLHIYRPGSKRVTGPERLYYVGPNGELPCGIVHEAEVSE